MTVKWIVTGTIRRRISNVIRWKKKRFIQSNMEMIWIWSVIAILGLFFSACNSTQVSRAHILSYLESVGNYWSQHPGSDPLICLTVGGNKMTINDPRVYQLVGIVCDDHATTNPPQNPVEAACLLLEKVSTYYLERFLPQLKTQAMLIPSSISINYKDTPGVDLAYDHMKGMFPAVCTKGGSPLVMEACQCLNLITIDHLIDVERHVSDRTGKERLYLARHCHNAIHGSVNYNEIKEMIPKVCDGKFDDKLHGSVMAQIRSGCAFYTRDANSILNGQAGNLIKNYGQAKPLIARLCKKPTTEYTRLMCDKVLKNHMEMLLGEDGPSGK